MPRLTFSSLTGGTCSQPPHGHHSKARLRMILPIFLATGLLAFLASPVSAQTDELNELATTIPGQMAATKNKLSTIPMGQQIYRVTAEVEEGFELKPKDDVDVLLVSLTDEGAKANPILRKVKVYSVEDAEDVAIEGEEGEGAIPVRVVGLLVNSAKLETLRLAEAQGVLRLHPSKEEEKGGVFGQVLHNFTTNLFQPLLLFFFMGFLIPLFKVPLDFPKALYQSLTLYLLVAIGWHGGELMAQQSSAELAIAGGLVVVGFFTNGLIGVAATKLLDWVTPMRKIDTVTVGAYYGSDSAGTFVTCLGILAALNILHDSYMPVLLAVMEIPGCLVGLLLVSRLRRRGMDSSGNMPAEPGYQGEMVEMGTVSTAGSAVGAATVPHAAEEGHAIFSWKILHEVFFNPGLYLLFGGIVVGFISGLQSLEDPHVVEGPNHLFVFIFKGALCLFLLEMGMTACRRLSDLSTAGWGFVAFGLLAPNLFALFGMLVLHGYSMILGHAFYLGTYALFAVLCGAASYIAVPAVQRLAIPEASPTLPLAASLGLTFTWNVTLGIPIYIEIAKAIIAAMPVA